MGFLGDIGDAFGSLGDAIDNGATALDKAVNNNNNQIRNFEAEGFIVPPVSSASGEGLPSSKVPFQRKAIPRRHIIHWFVPEVGVVNMYINPQDISYNYSKQISTERTKGGFVSQYWGENLPTLTLRGHTGSSGIEGLNVLYEIYRSEQLNFDPIGLTMASDSMTSGLSDLIDGAGQAIGGIGGNLLSSFTNSALGLNPLTQTILPRNPPTLSSLAFSIEMYYAGKIFRGYFNSMSWDESVNSMGLFNYQIQFTVTQERGYRLNTFGFQRSAISGPSNNSEGGIPLSYGSGFKYK